MILGLGHAARTGKDTAAAFLVAEHGFVRLSFADEVRRLALKVNPVITVNERLYTIVHNVGWEQAKSLYPEVRIFLQHLGTGCRDVLNDQIWVNRVVDKIFENPYADYVIPDVRFPNEIMALKRFQPQVPVHLVRVNRPGHLPSGHISETALKDYAWGFELDNDGTIEDLGVRVQEMLNAFALAIPA